MIFLLVLHALFVPKKLFGIFYKTDEHDHCRASQADEKHDLQRSDSQDGQLHVSYCSCSQSNSLGPAREKSASSRNLPIPFPVTNYAPTLLSLARRSPSLRGAEILGTHSLRDAINSPLYAN